MSSKAAKRKAEFLKREEKRQKERKRQQAIINPTSIEELAEALGINLGRKF